MKIGDNVKIKDSPFYDLHHKPYVGQSGIITGVNTIGKSVRYQVTFSNKCALWWFEGELETNDQAQKL